MYKKILVAIDDSETSRSALSEAMHIAKTSNAKLLSRTSLMKPF
jgi:nucleotide-binding universal stress UspA family protein